MRVEARHVLAVALVGCGIDTVGTLAPDDGATIGPDGKPIDGSAPLDANSPDPDGATNDLDATIDADAFVPPALFYVTTETQLFSYAPLTQKWTFLANISSCPNADEIAVNSKGEIYSTSNTQQALYRFDPMTYACTKVANHTNGPWDWSLSFVPKQTFDADNDTLVAYDYQDFFRIHLDKNSTLVTSNALSADRTPSGDIVSMGDRAFVSVFGGTGCNVNDCLFEINPKTSILVKNWGTFPSNEIWTLAQWAGKIYGFRSSGIVYEVTLGTPLVIKTLPGPDGSTNFASAGSSTIAPAQ